MNAQWLEMHLKMLFSYHTIWWKCFGLKCHNTFQTKMSDFEGKRRVDFKLCCCIRLAPPSPSGDVQYDPFLIWISWTLDISSWIIKVSRKTWPVSNVSQMNFISNCLILCTQLLHQCGHRYTSYCRSVLKLKCHVIAVCMAHALMDNGEDVIRRMAFIIKVLWWLLATNCFWMLSTQWITSINALQCWNR